MVVFIAGLLALSSCTASKITADTSFPVSESRDFEESTLQGDAVIAGNEQVDSPGETSRDILDPSGTDYIKFISAVGCIGFSAVIILVIFGWD